MQISAIIMMMIGCSIVWGGLFITFFIAFKTSLKDKEEKNIL